MIQFSDIKSICLIRFAVEKHISNFYNSFILELETLKQLFEKWSGKKAQDMEALPLPDSQRRYYRMTNGDTSVLGVYNPDTKENDAYIKFTRHFKEFEIPVPDVLSVSDDQLFYLVEDLGNDSLFQRVIDCKGQITEEVKDLYKKSLKYLVKMQVSAGKSLDYTYCYPVKKFDAQTIQWDLNFFKYNFLKFTNIPFDEYLLEKDFDALKSFLLKIPMGFFMFRDFQSRNILIKNGEPWFIDFQGGIEGPKSYDVASLLYQAKAQIPYETRKELFEYYFKELNKLLTVDYTKLVNNFKGFALLRTLEILGSCGFKGYYQKKKEFEENIPNAIRNLKFLLLSHDFPIGVPHLKEIATKFSDNS